MFDPLPADLAAALDATRQRRGAVGEPTYYFTETGSTNDVAAMLAERGATDGTTIVAGSQTAGRGRLGRSWHSPPGAGLYVSVIWRNPRALPFMTLAGGVAVATGIRAATALPVEIKWPNDVVIGGGRPASRRRKLAGVLAEATSDRSGLLHVVLGFGINLRPAAYPAEISDIATSLEAELGRPSHAGDVLGEVLSALAVEMDALARDDRASVLARWQTLAPSVVGSPVEWEGPSGRLSGRTAGIADDGALLVDARTGVERIIAGEVIWK